MNQYAAGVLEQWRRDGQPDAQRLVGLRGQRGREQGSGAGQGNERLECGGDGEEPEHPGDRGGEPVQGDESAQPAGVA